MQNQPGAARQPDAEKVQNGLYGLLSDAAVEYILNWPADKLDDRQKGNLTRLQHHFVGGLDDSADHDSSDATPLRQPETPTTTDSPNRDDSNSFNKAILAVTKLELDSSFQEFVENGFNQDQLREVLKKDSPRSVSKLAKELAKVSETIRNMSAKGRKFVGRDIISTMSDPDWKKTAAMVNIAQRLDSFCSHFSIGSIFYLVDILDRDKNLKMFKPKTVERTMQPSLTRLNELDISGEAKKSGMDKLGETMLTLIEDAWEKGEEVLEGDKNDTSMDDENSDS
ncbi:MAG: hypothetical protein Q9192_001515 [Flavoplaca navasiana]